MDHLHTLNDLTPKIKCQGRDGVDPSLLFGFDTKLFSDPTDASRLEGPIDGKHHEEVQTVTIWRGKGEVHTRCEGEHCGHHQHDHDLSGTTGDGSNGSTLDEETVDKALGALSKESVWRLKGFLRLPAGIHIVNWAFGRFDLTPMKDALNSMEGVEVKLTAMGEQGEVKRAVRKLAEQLGAKLL